MCSWLQRNNNESTTSEKILTHVILPQVWYQSPVKYASLTKLLLKFYSSLALHIIQCTCLFLVSEVVQLWLIWWMTATIHANKLLQRTVFYTDVLMFIFDLLLSDFSARYFASNLGLWLCARLVCNVSALSLSIWSFRNSFIRLGYYALMLNLWYGHLGKALLTVGWFVKVTLNCYSLVTGYCIHYKCSLLT